MSFFGTINFPLLCCLIGTIGVSSLASIIVRAKAEELSAESRDRITLAEHKSARLWHTLEWLGIALIFTGMFLPQMWLFTASSQRILTIAGGLELFCFSNASAAWASRAAYKREAPESRASRAALLGALMVSLAEVALLAVVVWIVSTRLNWFPNTKSGEQSAGTSAEESSDKREQNVWIDEPAALKELEALDRDYVQGMVESGSLRTKDVGGKKMYRLRDVQILKNRKKEVIP